MAFEDFWMSETAAPPTGASLRFNGAQSLSRLSPGAVTYYGKVTISFWVKLSNLTTTAQRLFASGDSTFPLGTGSGGAIDYNNTGFGAPANSFAQARSVGGATDQQEWVSSSFRDPGAWYHIVFVADISSTPGDVYNFYINGKSLPQRDFNYGTPNSFLLTRGYTQWIGGNNGLYYSSVYMSDFFAVAGTSLPATTFGKFDSNGVWVPLDFNTAKANVIAGGGFGDTGFALNFDSANFNSGTLVWADQSGNNNNFTANWNCATGSNGKNTTDIISDGPQVNASQFNMLTPGTSTGSQFTNTLWSRGGSWNLSRYGGVRLPDSGKWYFEWFCGNPSPTAGNAVYGFAGQSFNNLSTTPLYIGGDSDSVGWYASSSGGTARWYYNNVGTATGTSQTGAGAEPFRVGIAVDCDQVTPAVRLFIKINNITWSEQTSQTIPRSLVTSGLWPAISIYDSNVGLTWGAVTPNNPFPAANGYSQLYANLMPAAAVPDGSTGFQAILDTGANILTSAQTAFPDGLWWVKDRVNTNQHQLVDSINTSTSTLRCPANTVGAYAAPAGNSVAWCWATPVSGVNATTGFSITTGTHGLGASPQFVIDRQLNVYHASLGAAAGLKLSTTAASAAQAWTVNSTTVSGPAGSGTYYSWAQINGYSSFDSYTGNGSTNGPFVYTGMKPAWVLIKCSATTTNWEIYDNARNVCNPETLALQPNLTNAESTITGIDFLSNGFKIRTTDANFNTSGQTYIYAAFAEYPFGGSNVAPITAR